jgi:hypothetical protein
VIDEKRLEVRLVALEAAKSWSPQVVSRLEMLLRSGADEALYRINPIEFATEKSIAEAEAIDLFLRSPSRRRPAPLRLPPRYSIHRQCRIRHRLAATSLTVTAADRVIAAELTGAWLPCQERSAFQWTAQSNCPSKAEYLRYPSVRSKRQNPRSDRQSRAPLPRRPECSAGPCAIARDTPGCIGPITHADRRPDVCTGSKSGRPPPTVTRQVHPGEQTSQAARPQGARRDRFTPARF